MTTAARSGRGRRLWLIGMVVLLLGATVSVIWLVKMQTPPLLDIAAKVAAKGQYSAEEFAWVSDSEYVYFSENVRRLLRRRTSDGISTPLSPPLGDLSEISDLRASPNGEWIYWATATRSKLGFHSGGAGGPVMYEGPSWVDRYVVRLADMHTWKLHGLFGSHWKSDNRHLFEFTHRTDRTENTRKPVVLISDPFASDAEQTIPVEPNADSISSSPDMVMVAPNLLLAVSARDNLYDRGPAELIECRLDRTLHVSRKWSVKLPLHTEWEGKISPLGDRVAWMVTAEHIDPGLAALHRLLPFIQAPAQSRQELWTSRPDGTGMQIVGQIPIQKRSGDAFLITDLRWLPGGRRLSFVYEDALWTVTTSR